TDVGLTTRAWSAVSLSCSVAVTLTEARPLDETMMVRAPLVVSLSSAAARVTVWGPVVLAGKVSVEPLWMVMSGSPDPRETVTVRLVDSATASETWKVAVPFSGTVTEVGSTTSACCTVLSASVAVTVTGLIPEVVDATIIVRVPLVVSESCDAARVTVCGSFQLLGVKVRLAPLATVMFSSPVPAVEVTTTFDVGAEVSRTVKVAVPPSGTVTEVGWTTSCGVGCGEPLQGTPLMVKLVGSPAGPAPEYVPLKPTPSTVWLVPTFPFHGALRTISVWPDCDHSPLQPFCSCSLPGKVARSSQLVRGSPVLVNRKVPPKPPPMLSQFLVYVTSHDTAANAGIATTVVRPPATRAMVAPRAMRRGFPNHRRRRVLIALSAPREADAREDSRGVGVPRVMHNAGAPSD